MQPPRYETRAAIDRLNRILALPYMGWMQDWDIIRADAARVSEFCDLYETGKLNADEKFALMRLIIASVDRLLQEGATENAEAVKQMAYLLRQDFVLHFYSVEYWCQYNESDPENVFAVTPLLLRIWQDCFRPEYAQCLNTDDE